MVVEPIEMILVVFGLFTLTGLFFIVKNFWNGDKQKVEGPSYADSEVHYWSQVTDHRQGDLRQRHSADISLPRPYLGPPPIRMTPPVWPQQHQQQLAPPPPVMQQTTPQILPPPAQPLAPPPVALPNNPIYQPPRAARVVSKAASPVRRPSQPNVGPNLEQTHPLPPVDETKPLDAPAEHRSTINGGLKGSRPLVRVHGMTVGETQHSSSTTPPTSTGSPKLKHLSKLRSKSWDVQDTSPHVSSPPQRSFHDATIISLNMKEITLEHVIGGGAFGQVWRASWHGTPVAVKVLSSVCQKQVPQALLQAFMDEIQMLARMRHPNICLFMGAALQPPNRAIVTELVSRGSLWDVLRTNDIFAKSAIPVGFMLPWFIYRRVVDGTCRGLIYLHNHQPPIIHRDLKSANLLLDDSFNVKICDFGLARLRDYSTTMTANVGTTQWMAPEVLAGRSYNESADIYSLGIVMWELLTAECPFDGISQMALATEIVHKMRRPRIPDVCPDGLRRLIEICWAQDPNVRLPASRVLLESEKVTPSVNA